MGEQKEGGWEEEEGRDLKAKQTLLFVQKTH